MERNGGLPVAPPVICDLCASLHHVTDCPIFHDLEGGAVKAGIRERPMSGTGGYEWTQRAPVVDVTVR